MVQHGDRPSRVTVNLEDLLMRVENDHDLLLEMIGIFKEEFPPLLQSLQHSVASRDVENVVATSHALKGILSGLSVTRAAAIASQLEEMGREGKTSEMAETLLLLENEVTGLFPELDAYTIETEL